MDNDPKKALDKFINVTLNRSLGLGLEKLCQQIENTAKKNIAHKSKGSTDGVMAASITHEVDKGTLEAVIGTNVEYAPYYHQGTGLYAVNGDGRKEVPWHFIGPDGEWWHTKGQKPKPFLQDAIDSDAQKYTPLAFGEGAEIEWKK